MMMLPQIDTRSAGTARRDRGVRQTSLNQRQDRELQSLPHQQGGTL
jgi:hypothetical protein